MHVLGGEKMKVGPRNLRQHRHDLWDKKQRMRQRIRRRRWR